MSLPEKTFNLTSWNGNTQVFTAKQLYDRILKDSESEYNWFTSASELIRVCNNPYFPEIYSVQIKILILTCFASLELKEDYPAITLADREAVYSCYNSLPNTNETAKKVKENYLLSFITSITKHFPCVVHIPIYTGITFVKKVNEWRKQKLTEYTTIQILNFNKLRDDLYIDFEKMIKQFEIEGVFEEDKKEYYKKMKKFWDSYNKSN